MSTKAWFAIMAIFAFASFISFIQINSAASDKNNLHTVWLVAGIVCGLGALYSLYKANQASSGGGKQD